MRRLLVILCAALGLVACGSEKEDITLKQMESIVRYLTSSHSPRLIAEADLDEYMDDTSDPQFYSVFGRAAYRYIVNYYEDGRENQPQIERGDKVTIVYRAYNFASYNNVSIANLYATNDSALIEQMRLEGWTLPDEENFTFEPVKVTVGSEDLISGVSAALVGCRLGDEVEIYCTSSVAYGDKVQVGILPLDVPVYWYVVIHGLGDNVIEQPDSEDEDEVVE